MKNKKGFTLVEILAVICVIGIIIGIAVPATLSISARMKANMYCTKLEIIEKSANRWGKDNLDELRTRGNKTIIYISALVAEGYIKSEDMENDKVIDPRSGESMNDEQVGIFVKNKRVYSVILSAVGTCDIDIDFDSVEVD